MERRYHTCGCPIRVWEACLQRNGEPAFFDARTNWTERAIRTCPRCGQRLGLAQLHQTPPEPNGTLAAYLLAWPQMRQQIEALINERRREADFDALDAQHTLDTLEAALSRVAELAAGQEQRELEPV